MAVHTGTFTRPITVGKTSVGTARDAGGAGPRSTGAHQWWRLQVLATNGEDEWHIEPLFLYESGTTLAAEADPATYEPYAGSGETYFDSRPEAFVYAANAFVHDPAEGSSYDSKVDHLAFGDSYVGVHFDTAKDIRRYIVENRRYTANGDTAPTDWRLQYSDDGLAWYTRHEVTGHTWPATQWDADPETRSDYQVESRVSPALAAFVTCPVPQMIATVYNVAGAFMTSRLVLPTATIRATVRTFIPAPVPVPAIVSTIEPGGIIQTLFPLKAPKPIIRASITSPNLLSARGFLPTARLTGSIFPAGTFGQPLPTPTLIARATAGRTATARLELPAPSLTARVLAEGERTGTAIQTPIIRSTLHSGRKVVARIDVATPRISARIGNTVGAPLPLPALAASMRAGTAGTARFALPSVTLRAALTSGYVGAQLPTPALASSIVAGATLRARSRLATPTISARIGGTGAGILPTPSIVASIVKGTRGVAKLYLTTPTLTAAVQNDQASDTQATTVLRIVEPEVRATLLPGRTISARGVLPKVQLAAGISAGRLASAVLTIPLPELRSTLAGDSLVTARFELPLVRLAARIASSDATVATGEILALTLERRAPTRFDGIDANSFARLGDLTLVASAQGVLAFQGDDDAGTAIAASIRLGALDMGVDALKRVDLVHVAMSTDGALELGVTVDDGSEYRYPIEARRSDARHTARTRLGRGLEGRYWRFEVANVAGADFRIDAFEPDERVRGKRVL